MSVIAKVGEFLNMLTMQYELRYKWWINAVVMILSVPHCLCWSFYFQNIITFLFEKLSCAVEIFIWSDAVDFLIKLLGMLYSVVWSQRSRPVVGPTEMVNGSVSDKYMQNVAILQEESQRRIKMCCHTLRWPPPKAYLLWWWPSPRYLASPGSQPCHFQGGSGHPGWLTSFETTPHPVNNQNMSSTDSQSHNMSKHWSNVCCQSPQQLLTNESKSYQMSCFEPM